MKQESNRTLGNSFEEDLCQILFDCGFWVHNMAQNKAGQPADIICARNGKAYLIDAKVCTYDLFKLDRIEENQDLSMSLWQKQGNGQGWFAMRTRNEIYMIPHFAITALRQQKTTISVQDMEVYGKPLEKWVKWCK